jgi:hypothetical protein
MKRHRTLAKILFRNLSRDDRQGYPAWLGNYTKKA